jgi:hypothetical protein
MQERSSSTRCNVRRLIADFSVLALAGFSLAHAAVTQVVVRPYSSADRRLVADVAFDAPVCLATQNSGTLPQFQAAATDILQSRVSGSTVSIVLDTSASTTTCITSSVLTIFVPQLAPGAYTLRVADSKRLFAGNVYGNNVIQAAVSTTFTVAAPSLPTAIPVFLQQGKLGTAMSTDDAGAYQYFPTYASDTGRWQPVFYAWPWGSFEVNADELSRVFTLATRIPSLPERFFYTIDIRERDALVATGSFVEIGAGSAVAIFAAIPASRGACSSGRVTIYRAFEPKAAIHRYAPAATYSLLLANGWVGDGIAFCVASEPTGASSWAPN